MNVLFPIAVNFVSAMICFSLGMLVLVRSWRWRTHQTFALLCFNFMLWALGVAWVIQANTEQQMVWALRFTEVVPCFIAPFFYHFVGYFPKGQFDGNRKILYGLYAAGMLLAFNAVAPWYIQGIEISPGQPPRVEHHPSITLVVAMAFLGIGVSVRNLRRKYRESHGFGRRQIQFVITGFYAIAAFGPISVLIEMLFSAQVLQAYMPVSTTLMMSCFAYAMVRYHLLDTRAFVSQLLVYMGATAFVVVTFLLSMTVYNWIFVEEPIAAPFLPVFLTALLIAFAFPYAQKRVVHYMEVTLLRQRYDIDRLFTRISGQAAQLTQLDLLLRAVADDIRKTIGVRIIRVMLVDSNDPARLRTVYSSVPGEEVFSTRGYRTLLDFLREHHETLVLEKILHRRPDERMVAVARQLAELDAYFCLPLVGGDGLIGLMTLGQKDTHDIFSEEEQVAFEALAGPLGTAITNARLYNELERVHLHQTNVFSQMREGVVAVDLDARITVVNEAASGLMGRVQEGDPLNTLAPEVADLLTLTLREERPVNDFETSLTREGEEPVPVTLSSACLQDKDRRTTGAVALIYDLSLLKRLEQNVQRADRLSSIGILAAGMAHEIKNPLVSIKTFTQLLLERHMDEDFRQTFRDVVPHEVDRIDTIVSRLLDFARPRPVSFESVNIRLVVDQVLALVENQTRKYGIDVSVDFPDDDLFIVGDDQQLHQVFLNLVLNAVDAMKADNEGQLTVTARQTRMAFREIGSATLDTPCVRITVSDSGCGISSRQLQSLFTPFFTTKDDGCGLGLAVVHGIVIEHGGEIDVTSMPGEGTSFFVSLRLAEQPAVAEV